MPDTGEFPPPDRFCSVQVSWCHTSRICRLSLLCSQKLCWGWKLSHTCCTLGSVSPMVGSSGAHPGVSFTWSFSHILHKNWGFSSVSSAGGDENTELCMKLLPLSLYFGLFLAWILCCTFWMVHERFSDSQGSDMASPRVRHGEAWPGLKLFLHSPPTWSVSWLWTSRSALARDFLTSLTLVGLLSGLCLLMAQGLCQNSSHSPLCRLWRQQKYCFWVIFPGV